MLNLRIVLLIAGLFFSSFLQGLGALSISTEEYLVAGKLIWKNECGGKIDGLTSWNEGENFASLGIGHFTWYPKGSKGPFEEMFPSLIAFIQKTDIKISEWISKSNGCPWPTREAFLNDFNNSKMQELRQFLFDTIPLQANFIAERLEKALPKITKKLSDEKKAHVEKQFYSLASQPHGLYVLMDYVNFKGEGISGGESYQGQGWGLLQVLEGMPINTLPQNAIAKFSDSAKAVLTLRVKNSPPERNEKRWLQGWLNRIDSYQSL